MNIHIKSYLFGLALCGTALTSCESFDSINLNPNDPTPETVDPTFLLTPTMIKGTLDVDMYQRIHNLYVDNFAQYFANDKYASNNCVPVESWTQDFWDMHWQWIDALNEIIKNYSDDPKLVNTVQIARIWKVWLFHRATDLWGDIPYFQAADGSGLAAPYDPQKDIYYDMFNELTEASLALDTQAADPGKGDLIFSGDISRWKSFANSLRLRLAMRLTEVDPAKAQEEAENAQDALEIIREGISRRSASSSTTQVRSTITGMILDVPIKVGNSVIQSNTFNDGTTIASVADMNNMIFRGKVDETEVGRIHEGMPIKLTVGALDSRSFNALLEYVAPKGTEENGAVLFEIKAAVQMPEDAFIRAGYSANAEIVLKRALDVLTIPESCVEFSGDSTFVQIVKQEKPEQLFEKRPVTVGLSDGIKIEVKEGLTENDKIRGGIVSANK